nr:MAG TPA: hypothetical protein [Caudoviricetes sp.]
MTASGSGRSCFRIHALRQKMGLFQRRQDADMWKTFLLAKINAILLFL